MLVLDYTLKGMWIMLEVIIPAGPGWSQHLSLGFHHVMYTSINIIIHPLSSFRFRLRYCTFNDCYYHHWDDAACLPLAKINGLFKGLHSSSGVRRYVDDTTGEVCICVCMCACVHMCVRVYVCVHACVCMYVYVCMYV